MKTRTVYCIAATIFVLASPLHAKGYVYVHANTADNAIIQFKKNNDGSLSEVARIPTGGKGTGPIRKLHKGTPGPDPLASNDSIVMDRAGKHLFVINGGDGSVSAFKVDAAGKPSLLDREDTDNSLPNTLAYNDQARTLYVGHLFGPAHIRTMSFEDGDLDLRDESHTVDTPTAKGRGLSHIAVSPRQDYLLATVLVGPKPGGGLRGTRKDGLALMKIGPKGQLDAPRFSEAGGEEPFASEFMHDGSGRFVTVFAESNGAALQRLDADGKLTRLASAKVDDSAYAGKPLEICWMAFSVDKKYVYGSSFGTSDLVSFKIGKESIDVAKPSIGRVEPINDFTAAAGVRTSAPVDVWSSADGYLYQLYGAAGKLGAFRMTADGGLEKIALYDVPLYSTQGIVGTE